MVARVKAPFKTVEKSKGVNEDSFGFAHKERSDPFKEMYIYLKIVQDLLGGVGDLTCLIIPGC